MRDRRRALGLTQPQLADELGVTPLTIKRLEKKPELPRLYDLALRTLEHNREKEGGEVQS